MTSGTRRPDASVEEQAFHDLVKDHPHESPDVLRKAWDSVSDADVRDFIREKFLEDAGLILEQDPVIAEALIYRKHGLNRQASELLAKALAASPQRSDLRKLLAELDRRPAERARRSHSTGAHGSPATRATAFLRQAVSGLLIGSVSFLSLLALAYYAPRVYLGSLLFVVLGVGALLGDSSHQRGSPLQSLLLAYLLTLIPCVLLALERIEG